MMLNRRVSNVRASLGLNKPADTRKWSRDTSVRPEIRRRQGQQEFRTLDDHFRYRSCFSGLITIGEEPLRPMPRAWAHRMQAGDRSWISRHQGLNRAAAS
jgi:hypothetical protein